MEELGEHAREPLSFSPERCFPEIPGGPVPEQGEAPVPTHIVYRASTVGEVVSHDCGCWEEFDYRGSKAWGRCEAHKA